MGIIVETPYGDVVVTGDVKLDLEDGKPTAQEEHEYGIFKDRKVLLLLMDSTNVDRAGWSIPERVVHKTLEDLVIKTKGRIIVGTFASQLERLMKIVRIAEEQGRRIVVDGRSMKTNIEIVRELGILKHKDEQSLLLITCAITRRRSHHFRDWRTRRRIRIAHAYGNKTHKYISRLRRTTR